MNTRSRLGQLRPTHNSTVLASLAALHLTALQLVLLGNFFCVLLMPGVFLAKAPFLTSIPPFWLALMLGFFPASLNIVAAAVSYLLYRKNREGIALAVTFVALVWVFVTILAWFWALGWRPW